MTGYWAAVCQHSKGATYYGKGYKEMISLPDFLKRPSMAENLWGICSLQKGLYLHLHGRETKEDVIALHDKPTEMEIRTSRQTTRQRGRSMGLLVHFLVAGMYS